MEKEKIKKTLDELFEKAKTNDDWKELKFILDDYIEQGYNLVEYVNKYNQIVQKTLGNTL
jgi:predicted aldo/keto reductase-like oxidoreductase